MIRYTIAAAIVALSLAGAAAAQDAFATTFQRSVSGALDIGSPDARLMLVEKDSHGVEGARTLRIGDEYRDGWRLAALTAGQATLKKGQQTRQITLGGGQRQMAVTSSAPSATPAAPTGDLTGVFAQKPQAQVASSPAALREAIAKGDAAAVVAMGGAPKDALEALRAGPRGQAMGAMIDRLQAMGNVEYANINGRTAFAASDGQGRNLVISPGDLGPAPDGARVINTPPPGADGVRINLRAPAGG